MNETRERLIHAAIVCLERDGIGALTSRSVAREAGVNQALINYHFGGKAALIEEAMARTVANGVEHIEELLHAPDVPLRERLAQLFAFMLIGTRRYPNVARAHLASAFAGEARGAYLDALAGHLGQALDATSDAAFPEGREAAASAVELAVKAILLTTITPPLLTTTPPDPEAEAARLLRLLDGVIDGAH